MTMTITIRTILLILAFLLLTAAALGVASHRVNLLAAGLAVCVLADLVH